MKLHLPKSLLATVLAVLCVSSLQAEEYTGSGGGDGVTLDRFTNLSGGYILNVSYLLDFTDCDGFTIADNTTSGGLRTSSDILIGACGDVVIRNNDSVEGLRSGILEAENIIITGNDSVTFSENDKDTTYYQGYVGALADADSTIDISGNGDVTVANNVNTAGGGLVKGATLNINENNSVVFQNNSSASILQSNLMSISSNAVGVLLEGNTGNIAIYGELGENKICENGEVVFQGNSLFMDNRGTLEISGNKGLTVKANILQHNPESAILHAYQGMVVTDNGAILIADNEAQGSDARLISGGVGDVSFSENAGLEFSDNANFANIIRGRNVRISECKNVVFRNNDSVEGSRNGILEAENIIITGNDSVTFSENDKDTTYYQGYVGALADADSTIDISGNGDVTVANNVNTAGGGLIKGATLNINGNNSVTFRNNSASRLLSSNGVEICCNESVSFSDNICNGESGALWNEASSNISIEGNGNVILMKNAFLKNDSYVLRSIYNKSYSSKLLLSAKNGGSVIIYDSVYNAGEVSFNGDYVDVEGKTQKAKGDIIFSGQYTEAHLNDILEENGEDRVATAEEILNSQTSNFGAATLSGGTLQVVDGAIYQGRGITVHKGSDATVLVKDATLSHEGYALTFNAGTTLQVEGESLIVGDVLMMAQSVLNLEGETTINGALTLGLGMQLAGNILAEVQNLQVGESLTLVSGLESLAVQTQELVRSVEYTTVMDGYEVQASEYFSNLAGNTGLVMRYDGEAGTVSITHTQAVPEPTTATLSLLALAALAMRRRRK